MRYLLAVFVLLALPAAADQGRQVRLGFDVYAGGLRALNLGLALEVEGERYRLQGDARTTGAIDAVARWRSELETFGRIVDGRPQPERHRRDAWQRRKKPRTMELVYAAGGEVDIVAVPAAEAGDAALGRDTLDVLSALLEAALAGRPAAACTGSLQIFDGRRRFDLTFEAAGPETLGRTRLSAFSGRALRCRVGLRPIAGFRSRDGLGLPDEVTVWLARDDDAGLVLPVRLQADTGFGAVVAHLNGVSARPRPDRAGG